MSSPGSQQRLRIGVLGGTFDPPHAAHLALAEAARNALALDRVIFVPAGDPWRKAHREVSPAPQRLELVRAAVSDLPWAEVSAIEVERSGPSYTHETLAALAGDGIDLWFILGADALEDMAHWHDPAAIVALARLAAAHRPGSAATLVPAELRAAVPGIEACIDEVPMDPLDLSATDIRDRLRDGRSTEGMLPPAVRDLIDQRGWYQS